MVGTKASILRRQFVRKVSENCERHTAISQTTSSPPPDGAAGVDGDGVEGAGVLPPPPLLLFPQATRENTSITANRIEKNLFIAFSVLLIVFGLL